MKARLLGLLLLSGCAGTSTRAVRAPVSAQEGAPSGASAEELAKKLANPVAALISVPLQLNHDRDVGPADDGERTTLNIQPVVPITLNEDWNLISRTILPVISQSDVFPGADDESGIGDVVQSLFLSPAESDVIWGVGPVLLLPTASEDELGGEKWGAGPTAVVLEQNGPWTYGALANHIWSFAGEDRRAGINATFLQPFLSYTTPDAWTFTLNSESTYDWKESEWTVPVHVVASKVVRIGDQLISVGGGPRIWLDAPDAGPEGVGFRLFVTLLFPR